MNRLAAVLCVLGLASLPSVSAHADTYTYTYTGNDFTDFMTQGPITNQFSTNDFVTGSFTISSALAPDLNSQLIAADSAVFSDGVFTLNTGQGSTASIILSTDASGNIDDWSVILNGTDYIGGYVTYYTIDAFKSSTYASDSGSFVQGLLSYGGGNSYNAGTWTATLDPSPAATPEPSSLLLLATGALGGVAFFRRRLLRQLKPWSLAAPLLSLAALAGPAATAQCTNITSYVKGTATVGSDGWVIAHFTNNSNQTVHVDYTFKVNGQPSNSMADAGATSIRPGQTVGGELQGLYSTDADKNPAEIYWYAVPQSDIDAGKSCNHRW